MFTKVAKDVYGYMSLPVSFYFVVNNNKVILIDCGRKRDYKKLVNCLEKIGRSVGDIVAVLITHADGDHIGSLSKIIQNSSCKIYLGRITRYYIVNHLSPQHYPRLIGHFHQFLFDTFLKCHYENKRFRIVNDKEEFFVNNLRILPIFTPGHSNDDFSYLFMDSKVIFVGDLFYTFKGRLLKSFGFITHDQTMLNDSIKKITKYDFENLVCGHSTDVLSKQDIIPHMDH